MVPRSSLLGCVLLGAMVGLQDMATAQQVRVVKFNSDRSQRASTWMDYGEPVNLKGDYTLCLRFNLYVFRLLTALFYMLDKANYENFPISFEVYFEKIRTKYGGIGKFYPLPSNLATNKWYHYCHEVPLESLCLSVSRGRLTVPVPLLRYHDAVRVCRSFRGNIATPTTPQEYQDELEYFKAVSALRWKKPEDEDDNTTVIVDPEFLNTFGGCGRQWGGANDIAEDDLWYDPFTGNSLINSEVHFHTLNPDGGIYQNCLLMRYQVGGLLDTSCDKPSCTACHTVAGSTWTLRGICEEEERMFYFDLVAVPLAFQGYGEYLVDKIDDAWVWYNTITNTTMATLPAHTSTYPMGRLAWDLKTPVCEQESGQRELTLSPCAVGEFTCSDGSCIPFVRRCDLKFDCGDKTDEAFCDIVNFPDDYRSKLPPRPVSDLSLPISVNISMDTINIDTTTMLLSVSYNLRMTWHDNRLTYNNLKMLTRLNTVSQEQVDQLWRPQVGFINTDDIQNTVVDQNAVTTILRRDTSYVPDLSNSYEVEIYRGDTNPVSTTRKYSTVFTCNFNLVLYPFDIQTCYMRLQILSASKEYLIFNETDSQVRYLGQKLLVEYGIGKIDLKVDDQPQYSEMRVRVELIRRYGYAMLNIYIPSLTLLTISYVTLFFRPSIFEVRVMTALTALLVLATLFTQVSTSLPKTSYFKMVDIWLLFCIMLIFFIIIFHTIIDLQVDYSDAKSESWATTKGKNRSPVVSPIEVLPAGNGVHGLQPKSVFSRNLAKINFNQEFYISLSKYTMFLVFLVFNVTYWGTLAKDSGLVYNY